MSDTSVSKMGTKVLWLLALMLGAAPFSAVAQALEQDSLQPDLIAAKALMRFATASSHLLHTFCKPQATIDAILLADASKGKDKLPSISVSSEAGVAFQSGLRSRDLVERVNDTLVRGLSQYELYSGVLKTAMEASVKSGSPITFNVQAKELGGLSREIHTRAEMACPLTIYVSRAEIAAFTPTVPADSEVTIEMILAYRHAKYFAFQLLEQQSVGSGLQVLGGLLNLMAATRGLSTSDTLRGSGPYVDNDFLKADFLALFSLHALGVDVQRYPDWVLSSTKDLDKKEYKHLQRNYDDVARIKLQKLTSFVLERRVLEAAELVTLKLSPAQLALLTQSKPRQNSILAPIASGPPIKVKPIEPPVKPDEEPHQVREATGADTEGKLSSSQEVPVRQLEKASPDFLVTEKNFQNKKTDSSTGEIPIGIAASAANLDVAQLKKETPSIRMEPAPIIEPTAVNSNIKNNFSARSLEHIPATPFTLAAPNPLPSRAPSIPHLASGFANIDDVDAIPYISDKGRDHYRDWLTKATPRAFAISSTGASAYSAGLKSTDDSLSADPSERAVLACNRVSKVACSLYAVNGSVVWRRPSTNPAETLWPSRDRKLNESKLDTSKSKDAHALPVPPNTNFASLKDVDAVPNISDTGKALYKEWLTKPFPRAVAISDKGALARGYGPNGMEVAIRNCEKFSHPCRLYAVDDEVVWRIN